MCHERPKAHGQRRFGSAPRRRLNDSTPNRRTPVNRAAERLSVAPQRQPGAAGGAARKRVRRELFFQHLRDSADSLRFVPRFLRLAPETTRKCTGLSHVRTIRRLILAHRSDCQPGRNSGLLRRNMAGPGVAEVAPGIMKIMKETQWPAGGKILPRTRI